LQKEIVHFIYPTTFLQKHRLFFFFLGPSIHNNFCLVVMEIISNWKMIF
jgi:hypothetical protein